MKPFLMIFGTGLFISLHDILTMDDFIEKIAAAITLVIEGYSFLCIYSLSESIKNRPIAL